MDIAKEFDSVSHKLLLNKLVPFGLPLSLVAWIRSYLTNRSITVVSGWAASKQFQIFSGVPQGAIISPSLFLIFINDLTSTQNPIHSFADERTLYFSYYLSRSHSLNDVLHAREVFPLSINRIFELIN